MKSNSHNTNGKDGKMIHRHGARSSPSNNSKLDQTLRLSGIAGGAFLGQPCTPTKVLYLTEQTEHEFKRQVREVPDLLGNPNFFVLLAEDTPPEIKSWDQMLVFIERMLAVTKAKIVVLDTFIGLAKLPPEGENDSATIQNNINKLNLLFKNRYLSVVFQKEETISLHYNGLADRLRLWEEPDTSLLWTLQKVIKELETSTSSEDTITV